MPMYRRGRVTGKIIVHRDVDRVTFHDLDEWTRHLAIDGKDFLGVSIGRCEGFADSQFKEPDSGRVCAWQTAGQKVWPRRMCKARHRRACPVVLFFDCIDGTLAHRCNASLDLVLSSAKTSATLTYNLGARRVCIDETVVADFLFAHAEVGL